MQVSGSISERMKYFQLEESTMNIFGNALAALIVLALLGALGASGYFAFDLVVGLFASLESQAARITACASTVALLAAIIIASSIRQAGRQIRANRLSAEKGATYRLFIELWENLLNQGKESADRGSTELSKELRTLDLLLSLYGSPAVIKGHTTLRMLEQERGARNEDLRAPFARALVEIRKDLGSDTHGLAAEELRQLLLPASDKANISTGLKDTQLREALGSNP